MRKPMKTLIICCGLSFFIQSTARASDFPSCDLADAESMHQEKFERFSLGSLHSITDSCAFGDRINSMINGAMSEIFGRLTEMLNFDDENFFCGFGTQQLWQAATEGTAAEGTENFNAWRRKTLQDARSEVGIYRAPWGGKYRLDPANDNVFELIFNPGPK